MPCKMHCALILAGLTALVAAAPIKTVDEIKHVSHRSYGQYDSYLMAADKEAAKMQMGKISLNFPYLNKL